jgi:hypothetical protein
MEEDLKNKTVKQVLEICEIPKSVNIKWLSSLLSDYMEPRANFFVKKNKPPSIENSFAEFFTAESSKGTDCGDGSCAVDVTTNCNEGIDVTCVIMKNTFSNEKSLIQNFSSSGKDLDSLFINKNDKKALNLFKNEYLNKLNNVKEEKELTNLYILAFISTKKEIYAVCFKVNIENIKHVTSGGFLKNNKKEDVNIIVNNFINPSYGKVNLYKSKKRMELRFKHDVLKNEHVVKLYNMI